MPFMYMLECSDGSFYVGSTVHLERRPFEHEQGLGAKYTRTRRPVRLVYYERYERIAQAFAREKHVQGWSRAKRKALLAERGDELPELSKKVFREGDSG